MKIWIVNQYASTPETGGSTRHVNIGAELAGLGYDVTVIGARWYHKLLDQDAALAAPEIENRGGWRYVRVPVPQYKHGGDPRRGINWIVFALRLARLDKRLGDRPDVVFYSSPSLVGYLGAERLARRIGARLIFEVRDIWPLTLVQVGGKSPLNPIIRWFQWIEDRALRNADAVVSNLPNAVEHMVTRGMDAAKFTWIPNGFNAADMAEPMPLDPTILDAIPKRQFLVGYTGAHGPANGLDSLLDAAVLLKDDLRFGFLLVGKGNQKDRLMQRAKTEKLDNVTFLEPVQKRQVPLILKHLDVCYIGLKNEPLFRYGVSPNKLFDYVGAARPVLFAIDAGPYRPVEEMGAGIQIPPEDPEALHDALLRFISMPDEEREAMGRNGKEKAVAMHEYGVLAKRIDAELLRPYRSEDG